MAVMGAAVNVSCCYTTPVCFSLRARHHANARAPQNQTSLRMKVAALRIESRKFPRNDSAYCSAPGRFVRHNSASLAY
jgi:hypothetical protein